MNANAPAEPTIDMDLDTTHFQQTSILQHIDPALLFATTRERNNYAAHTAIGLLEHSDRLPNYTEAEIWPRQHGRFEHAKQTAIEGRCRAALALLHPPTPRLDSLRDDHLYRQFSLPQLKRLVQLHGQLPSKAYCEISHAILYDWTHPVPFIGLHSSGNAPLKSQSEENHPGKPDQGILPGNAIGLDSKIRLYADIHDIKVYHQESTSVPQMTIQEISSTLYQTTTTTQPCNTQYAKACSLFACQLLVHSSLVCIPVFRILYHTL
jgi:hypothetical protein